MSSELESELNEAFSRHVAQLPPEAVDRIRRVEYHPRASRVSPRVRVGAVAGAAATGAAVVSVTLLAGSQAAFAGWTPTPTAAPSSRQISRADATCLAHLAGLPDTPAGATWTPVATDVRGPFTLDVYRDGSINATCVVSSSMTAVGESDVTIGADGHASGTAGGSVSGGVRGGGSESVSNLHAGGLGSIRGLSVLHLSAKQGSYTVIEGQVASGVSGVTLVRSDGVHVQTTTGGGSFVAWWPGTDNPVSAEITTATGTTSEPIPGTPTGQPGPSGASGTSGSGTSGSGTSGSGGKSLQGQS
jgi:hypothetical protein